MDEMDKTEGRRIYTVKEKINVQCMTKFNRRCFFVKNPKWDLGRFRKWKNKL